MLTCHLFSRRVQAALLLLGVKTGTVSYGEPWPGQQFRSQQATWTLLYSQGSQDQIPHPRPFPRAGGEGTRGRWCGSPLPQSEAVWVTVRWGWGGGLCHPSPTCAQFILIRVDLHLLLLSAWPHLRGCSYYLQFTDKATEPQRDLHRKDLNSGLSVCLSPNAIFSLPNLTTLPEKSSTALLGRGGLPKRKEKGA